MQGNTDAKILQRRGVHIWDGNTSREFLDGRGLQHYPEGILGAGYGWQLRHHGAEYSSELADVTTLDRSQIGGFDQLKYVEDLLKNEPFSRRIMFSYWNPSDFHKTALIPCHTQCQFYVTEDQGVRYLSCMYGMRSNDFVCGKPFNLVFYSVLTYILAKRNNMLPKEIIYTCGDCHIYSNHEEQVREQLKRTPRPFPKLKLNDSLVTKDWSEMTVDDFEIIGYFPHPKILAPMAI
jgi:thymidylate synthase